MAVLGVVVSMPVLAAPPSLVGRDSQEGRRISARTFDSPALYDQNNNCGVDAISSQEFEAALSGFTNRAADDFVVSEGVNWVVDEVFVNGLYLLDDGPTPLVDVEFLTNSGGLPATAVAGCTYNDLATFTDTAGDLEIPLPVACTLLAGNTYWVTVRADMDTDPNGQWFWQERTVQSTNPSAWENPGDGFGTDCESWEARVATCHVGTQPDLCFTLFGLFSGTPTVTVSSTPTVTGTSTPTATITPTATASGTSTATVTGTITTTTTTTPTSTRTSTPSTTPTSSPTRTPTLIATLAAPAIPTVSGVGAGVLLVLLLGAGLVYVVKSRR